MRSHSHLASFLILTLSVFLIVTPRSRGATAQHPDSIACIAQCAIDQETASDSLEATSNVMVPFRAELYASARRHALPASLLAAICQEESGFNQWAERSEPSYMRNKKVRRAAMAWSRSHQGLPTPLTEQTDRAKSFGLMQPMGEVAREQGFDSTYLSALFDPKNSIEQGALRLRTYLNKYGRDTLAAISAYNAGTAHKAHGLFEITRYAYRVNIAWKHYSQVFKYGSSIQSTHAPQPNLQMASDRSGRRDSISPAKSDSAGAIAQNQKHGDERIALGTGASEDRHDPPSRHRAPRADFLASESERNTAGTVIFGFVLAGLGLFGYFMVRERHVGDPAGLDRSVLQSMRPDLHSRSTTRTA